MKDIKIFLKKKKKFLRGFRLLKYKKFSGGGMVGYVSQNIGSFFRVSVSWNITQMPQQRFHNVVTTSWLTLSQHWGMVENESCDNVMSDVATTLLQRYNNIKHLVSRPFYYRQFWFLSHHRNVRELQKYLSIESSLW